MTYEASCHYLAAIKMIEGFVGIVLILVVDFVDPSLQKVQYFVQVEPAGTLRRAHLSAVAAVDLTCSDQSLRKAHRFVAVEAAGLAVYFDPNYQIDRHFVAVIVGFVARSDPSRQRVHRLAAVCSFPIH